MRKIEERFPNNLVVIGVHSGKYIAERETSRIREASLRYEIQHSIVNDRQFRVWRSYAVRAWPTIAVIDRDGYVVGAHAGEFTAEMFDPLLDALTAGGGSDMPPHSVKPERPGIEPGLLRYPGKVVVDRARIAISDTGHHRVVYGELTGAHRMKISRTFTDLKPGPQSRGDIHAFRSPQGLAFAGERLYVADSESHVVAVLDIARGDAKVLAGTGEQMRTRSDRASGALSSPWDLCVIDGTIYVAMAGVHQLWAIDPTTGTPRVHCGAGGEDIADGPLGEALLAQPMGITTDGNRVYFADAESSAVRWADTDKAGSVGTIVGTGLFDFGDADGTADKVRMQHQQGLAVRAGELLVADSYNDALKWVNVETREARTWVRGFHEPGGVATGERHAYVADINAHRIVVVDYETGAMEPLEIVG
ncbi:MAG TPA: alkyl hydroperoxide reductase [Gemmatimonadaceae bacterium]|nr:alkyl hydroperoxide reductase [Gemmatimonadaceae bacterium]